MSEPIQTGGPNDGAQATGGEAEEQGTEQGTEQTAGQDSDQYGGDPSRSRQ